MLKDLLHSESIIHIAGREYPARYSLNALLCLEMTHKPLDEILSVSFSEWSIEDVIQLAHAAMCDLPKNRKAVNRRKFEYVRPTVAELGMMIEPHDLPALRAEIVDAILNSFPDEVIGGETNAEKSHEASDEGHLRALAVDVVGIPEDEFWRNSYRDNYQRIDKYLEVKGMKDMPVEIQMTDKDD